jgi:hypothetical protein
VAVLAGLPVVVFARRLPFRPDFSGLFANVLVKRACTRKRGQDSGEEVFPPRGSRTSRSGNCGLVPVRSVDAESVEDGPLELGGSIGQLELTTHS